MTLSFAQHRTHCHSNGPQMVANAHEDREVFTEDAEAAAFLQVEGKKRKVEGNQAAQGAGQATRAAKKRWQKVRKASEKTQRRAIAMYKVSVSTIIIITHSHIVSTCINLYRRIYVVWY
jgi:hypothetical protein